MNPPLNTPEDGLRIEHSDPKPARAGIIRWLPNRMGGELIANAGEPAITRDEGIEVPPGSLQAGESIDLHTRAAPEGNP